MDINPTLLGVIIGSVLSIVGGVVTQLIVLKKEEDQWGRQNKAENQSWERNERKSEKEYLREIYQNSLLSISVFIALENKSSSSESASVHSNEIGDIQKWTTILLLRHSDEDLRSQLSSFTFDPNEFNAKRMHERIIKLSNLEERFFVTALSKEDNIPKKSIDEDPEIINIGFLISKEYRRVQLIEGLEIPQSFQIKIKSSDLNKNHRTALIEVFFEQNQCIPKRLNLFLPTYNETAVKINFSGKKWEAELVPSEASPLEILDSWEESFTHSLAEVRKSISDSVNV
jgi:hypothetical protein